MFAAETYNREHTVFAQADDRKQTVHLRVRDGCLPQIGVEIVAELEFNLNEARDLIRALELATHDAHDRPVVA